MDPVSVVGLVEGSISLAVQCGSVAKSLNSLAGQYKYAKLTISTMVQNLDIMQLAWDRIGAWSKDFTPTDNSGFTHRLENFLGTGFMVLDALQQDLQSYDAAHTTFAQRSRLVWNEGTLQGHQNRIRDQAQSMSLLLQAIQLTDLLQQSKKQFMKSDESAFSIVPSKLSSRLSLSTNESGDHDSLRSYESMVYHRLSFEDELFTARVYKRNYRNPRWLRLRKKEPDLDHGIVTPRKEDRQSTKLKDALMALPPSRVLASALPRDDGILVTTTIHVSTSSSAHDPYEELIEACRRGDKDRVKNLMTMIPEEHSSLTRPQSCDSLHPCPVHATVSGGHVEVMETILQQPDSKLNVARVLERALYCKRGPPLHLAVVKGDLPMVQVLLENGASVNERWAYRRQAIHLAASNGSMAVLAALVAAGADVNCADKFGRQPLHYISECQDLPHVIEYLAEAGANVNGRTHQNKITPVRLACREDLVGNLIALLSLGALAGGSDLDTAIIHGSPLSVETLLRRGIDPNCCGCDGVTGLHSLVLASDTNAPRDESTDKRILQLLLEHIDLLAKDHNGDTVLSRLFRLPGISDERMLELARLFLANLPELAVLEKTVLLSMIDHQDTKEVDKDASASSGSLQSSAPIEKGNSLGLREIGGEMEGEMEGEMDRESRHF